MDRGDSTGRQFTIHLEGYGRLGEALGKADGKPVFVHGGISGETVLVEVIADRRTHTAARVLDVIERSPKRSLPSCPYVPLCTGCQWQHIDYDHQLELKRTFVMDALERVGGLKEVRVLETLGCPSPLGYRNHARFTVGPASESDGNPPPIIRSRKSRRRPPGPRSGRLGYVHRESRRHVEIDECLLMAPWINHALRELQGLVHETTQLSLRYGINTGDWLLQPTLQNPDVPLESGQKSYRESLFGHEFQVSSPSFFQVNTVQAERLGTLVIEALELDGNETVVDAYAGVGTFAVLLSSVARKIIAVEESASALVDARINVRGIDNIELRQARTEDVLGEISREGLDAVILDPPRSGCMPGTLEALIVEPPSKVVYVSCDPDSLARDLAVLVAGPFSLQWVCPVDMFPQTHHIETVALLHRDPARRLALEARQNIILASASPRRSQILSDLGIAFRSWPSDVEEPPVSDGIPKEIALQRAILKAEGTARRVSSGTVLGFDTVVDLDGRVLGKPANDTEAWEMLCSLRGREHSVVTAVALVDAATKEISSGYRTSRVQMRKYSDGEIDLFVTSGSPFDKAGGYAVQDPYFRPAAQVLGCYLNVVGLPICTLLKLLRNFGLRIPYLSELTWAGSNDCPECRKQMRRTQ